VDDSHEFIVWDVSSIDLDKSILESFRQLFTSSISFSGILSGKDSEVGMSLHCLLSLDDEEFVIVVEESIESFKHFRRCEIQFIKNHPISISNSLNEDTFLEMKLSASSWNIRADVFLDVCVLMIIDTDTPILCSLSEILNS